MSQITYEELFVFLKQLGFQDKSRSKFERVSEHTGHGVLLAFSMLDDANTERPVRAADLTTVEFQLRQHDLLDGELQLAIERVRER